MADDDRSEFVCARGDVHLEWLTDPGRPNEPLLVLYEKGELLCQVGRDRDAILKEPAPSNDTLKHRRVRLVDSKKVLTTGDTLNSHSPQLSDIPVLEAIEESDNEEVTIPAPMRLSTISVPKSQDDEEEEEEEDEYYRGDTMCAWCDDGGNLVMCDGPCFRGFHMDHICNPLNVPEDLKMAVVNSKHPFECPNCWSRTHRCFSCKKEVKMDVTSDKPLLVKCDFADCGKFYCIKCQDQIVREIELNFHLTNRTRHTFICPLHFCAACGTVEDATTDILFPCRRCPKALHERCMSKKIHDDPTRVWRAMLNKDGTLSHHTQVSENFFYCGRHQTQNMMQGPLPDVKPFSRQLWKRWRMAYALKFRCLASSAEYIPTWTRIKSEDLSVALSALNEGDMPTGGVQPEAWRIINKKRMRMEKHMTEADLMSDAQHLLQRDSQKIDKCRHSLRLLIEDSVNDVSLKSVEEELAVIFPYNRRHSIRLTEDRLDYFIHSLHRADADPSLSKELLPSKLTAQMRVALRSMRISCAPFLKPNYTSYGRHFTKTHILRHITNHIIAHLKPNDLIVDFSCGANEFIGIVVDFCKTHNLQVRVKAFDLFTPLRMDGFVRKNWFDVTKDDLDDGRNLIMGLNPPFGVDASLASQFVRHAAKFAPRMLMLVCPPETIIPESYAVFHEDPGLCKDRAFYIPGLRTDHANEMPTTFRILKRRL